MTSNNIPPVCVYNTITASGSQTIYETSCYFFGYLGVTCALVFANMGAAYGTAKSGIGISYMGTMKPELIFKSIVPIIMAGILGIYGLIVAVILISKVNGGDYTDQNGY